MRLTVVGSGTAAPEAGRVCSGYLVEHGDTRILLDCGPGVVHHLARFDLPWATLDHVFLTHYHNDHIGDLPMLLFAMKHALRPGRARPLALWGPRGLNERLRAMAAGLGGHVADPGFPLLVRELAPGDELAVGGVGVGVAGTPHTEESVCFRLSVPGGTLAYTGDTGPSEAVAAFLADADVLLAECSVPDEVDMDSHLTPSSLARMAQRARPGRLVVTHVYPELDARGVLALVRAAGWSGEAIRAADGLSLPVDDATPRP